MTIPSGSATAPITLTPIDDSLSEVSETAMLTLSTNPAYTVGSPNTATVTITDNDAQFRHVVIEADGPLEPHVKAVRDISGDGRPIWWWVLRQVVRWCGTAHPFGSGR